MVSCEWFDIVSDSWGSFEQIKKSELATCITKARYYRNLKV